MKAAVLCALTLAGLAAGSAHPPADSRAGAALCTAPPAPGGATRTIESGRAKPSSFAPHPRSHRHAYGAPVPRPIVPKHAKHKRRAASPPPSR